MELTFHIDDECTNCKEALEKVAEYRLPRPTCYSGTVLGTYEWLPGIVIHPDYNSSGILTNWHVCMEHGGKAVKQ